MQQTSPPPSPHAASPFGLRAAVTWLADEDDPHFTGARVVEPPRDTKQAVRGSLYAVVQLDNGHDDPESARLCERMLSTLQRTYYTAKGSQSVVLAEALRAAHQVVREHNTAGGSAGRAPLRVSVACASLLNQRLMAACSGAGFLLLRHEEQVELSPTDPEALHSIDPAAAPEPVVLRRDLEAGDAVLLCGPGWLDRLTLKMLAAVVYHVTPESAEEFADGLREQAGGGVAPGLLLALESEGPPPPPRPSTPLTTPRRSPGALPTSLSTSPPVSAPAASAHAPDEGETLFPGERHAQEITPFPAPAVLPAPVSELAPAQEEDAPDEPEPLAPDLLAPSTADRIRHGAGVGIDRARTLFRQMLPDARGEGAGGESAGGFEPLGDLPPELIATPAEAAAPIDELAAESVRPLPFAPPAPARGGRARLFITLALLIALLVPVIVGAYFWKVEVDNRANAETLLALAQGRVASAQAALDADDTRATLDLLSEAEDYLDRSVELVGPTSAVTELRQTVRRIEADAAEVQPLYALLSPLVTLPSGAAATRVMVVDQDIYILDPGRGMVERYRLDQTLENVPEQVGDPVLSTGDTIGGAVVGELLDIAWQPVIPGYDDKATLLVLDDKNQVFRFDPRVEGPGVLELMGAESFGALSQIESFTGRLYLTDAGRGQLLRYPAGQNAVVRPDDWFAAPIALDELRALRIDGDVWLLMRDGRVIRFNAGEQEAFSLDNSVGLMREPVDFVVGDGTNPYIYVADGGGERVWVFDREGQYVKQLAAPEGNPLRGLSGIFIEDVTDSLFLLTDGSLYKHPLPRE